MIESVKTPKVLGNNGESILNGHMQAASYGRRF